MSASDAVGCSAAVVSEDNSKTKNLHKIVAPTKKKCICKELYSDCQYLIKDLKTLTKEIMKRQPEAGDTVRHVLQTAHTQLAVMLL